MKYKIIVDKQPKTNPSSDRKTYEIDIEELRYKGDVKDTLVITKDEDYVMRRLSLSEYHVLSVLDEPKKEPLDGINIELFEGDNYIYIADETGSRFYAEYLITNEFNDMYALRSEVNSKIEQLADSVEIGVNKKLEGYSTTDEMNAAIKVTADEINNSVSKKYTTKDETTQAKNDAINKANSDTNDKLQNYSTTTQMNSAINQKAGEVTIETNKSITTAKKEAIDSSNNTTDDKLKSYSTTEEVKSMIKVSEGSISLEVSQAKQEAIDSANSTTNDKLSNYTTTEQTEQAKQAAINAANSNTNTQLTNYSTKDETTQAKNDAINKANSDTNDKLQNYSTTAATNQAKQDAINSANSSTDTKLQNYSTIDATNQAKQDAIDSANTSTDNKLKNYSTTTEITGKLQLKIDKNDNDQVVSMINASANEIKMLSNRLSIQSDNFSLTNDGKITATAGDIGGFGLEKTKFNGVLNGIYDYDKNDLMLVRNIVMGWIEVTNSILNDILDCNDDGKIASTDFTKMQNIIYNGTENTKKFNGAFEINSNNPRRCVCIKKDGEIAVSMGIGGINTNAITADVLLAGTYSDSYSGGSGAFSGVILDGELGRITILKDGSVTAKITKSGNITCNSLTQTSLESKKKNFEKLKNGLDIIKNVDIYRYNLLDEEDGDKKHVGFVIGDGYKYSKEITSEENDGVDLYSMVSVAYKAIQEQQEQINQLKQEIDKLKEGRY